MKKDWMVKESELDDDQLTFLTSILDKSCIVAGCAGSGKSVLALMKAQRIQRERGNSYTIVVYTKALCAYMNSGRKELGLNNQFTYHWHWKNRLDCPSTDYMIVDEIQDFNEEEIREFIKATNKHFFFFGDTAQSIYDGMPEKGKTVPVDEIFYLVRPDKMPKKFDLLRNYRLPKPIAKFVQSVGIDLVPYNERTYRSPENKQPFVLRYASREEQVKAIAKLIGRCDDVAILLPHNDYVKQMGDMLKAQHVNVEMKYTDQADWRNSIDSLKFDTTNPKIMTYHSAKGLQFETVILPWMETFADDNGSLRKALYVAMTRTYRNLYIMYSGQLVAPLNSISTNLYRTSIDNETEDI